MSFASAAQLDNCAAGSPGEVIAVDIASAKAVASARPLSGIENLSLMDARGRVVASAVSAQIDLPPFDNSAMDGYAVALGSLEGDGPWQLPAAGRVAAGGHLDPNTPAGGVIRILTGAPVPRGYDAVVMQENCRRTGHEVVILKRPRPGENIRKAGEDVIAGKTILRAGEILTPQRLALLAGQGLARVDVIRRVRVGLVSTGSELREPGAPLAAGQIYNSNRIMIASMLAAFPWAEIVDFGIVPDQRDALAAVFGEAARLCDALVTTGGVSGGDEDHVVSALGANGGSLDVLKVAMRPGKPVKIGTLGDILFLGLPGNPNAALVTFRQIALPAIRTIAGLAEVKPTWAPAVCGFAYDKRFGRTEFVPVRINGRTERGLPVLDMLGRGSSASLAAMAAADGIALLPPDLSSVEPGLAVQYEPISS